MRAEEICKDIGSPDGFLNEVRTEIASEERMLQKVSRRRRGYGLGIAICVALLGGMVLVLLTQPDGILLWLIVAFVLYSFNYIILFLPTTRKLHDPEACHRSYDVGEVLRNVRLLLKENRKLAIEVGLTMFLGGMVPLAASLFIIFGIGLFFALYFGFLTGTLDPHVAQTIVVQVLFIIFFFVMMLVLEPQSQGFSRIAIGFKDRIVEARERSRLAFVAIIGLAAIVVAIVAVLFIGAVLLTGTTLAELVSLEHSAADLLLFVLILAIQVVVMRHFQAVSSRRMARKLLEERLESLREDVLRPLEELVLRVNSGGQLEGDGERLEDLKRVYFSIATYGIVELNFFGHSPVYVVGPKVKYIMDPRVMPYLGV